MTYDLIIIGAGPAGLSAAIYAVRKKVQTLILSKDVGGQAAISGNIENYLGFSLITGAELAQKFRQHLAQFKDDLTLIEGITVAKLEKTANGFSVQTEAGEHYEGRTVIIASGRVPKMLGIPGEQEFLGKGVATCATCDAPFFKDKDVAVVGGGNSALDAILVLTKFAKLVYGVNVNPEYRGEEALLAKVKAASNVQLFTNLESIAVLGEKTVNGLNVRNGQANTEETLTVQGVFVEIGWTPSAFSFDQLTAKDQQGQIIVNDNMETSVPGLWAAGDVNSFRGEQIVIAAGEGAKAGLNVADHLARG